MNILKNHLFIRSMVSGVVLTASGAFLFVVMTDKTVAHVILLGGFVHYLLGAFALYKNKKG